MKLSIFTGDAFCSGYTFSVPVFRKSKARFARYNSISSVDCLSCFPAFTGIFYPIVHGSRPTAVRLVMNILVFLPFLIHSGTLYECLDASLTRQVIVRFCSCLPESLSASFDIISILCSDSLLRHHTHQYAHRPLDAHYFWLLQASSRILFIRQRIVFQGSFMLEPYFPAASIHLHRQYVSRMDITRIASSKVPFLTSFRSRSRFSGGSFYWSGTRSFL